MAKYINNKHFYQALCKRIELKEQGDEESKTFKDNDHYLALCFMKLADNIGKKPNFSNYTYLDDMKMDGVFDCFLRIEKFDPSRSQNPFAYFTTTIKNAFKRRIIKENKSQKIVTKNVIKVMDASSREGHQLSMEERAYLNKMQNELYEYEEKQKEKANK